MVRQARIEKWENENMAVTIKAVFIAYDCIEGIFTQPNIS